MDWLTFITKETWPAIVVLALLLFRRPLADVIDRLRELGWSKEGGFRLKLDKEIEKASAEAAAAGIPISGINFSHLTPSDPFINLAQTFPEMGIIQSWIDVERTVRDIAIGHDVERASTGPTIVALSALRKREVIDERTFRLIDELRVIRNEVVHGRTERPPTPGQALQFYNLSRAVLERLHDSAKLTP